MHIYVASLAPTHIQIIIKNVFIIFVVDVIVVLLFCISKAIPERSYQAYIAIAIKLIEIQFSWFFSSVVIEFIEYDVSFENE